jgi:hypothetical protein
LKFGFVPRSLTRLSQPEIIASRWELAVSQMYLDHFPIRGPKSGDIMAALEEFDNFNWADSQGGRLFVRDTDLDGNNRLYQPCTILEYPDDHNQKPQINCFPCDGYGKVGNSSTWDQYGDTVGGGTANGRASAWRRIMYV